MASSAAFPPIEAAMLLDRWRTINENNNVFIDGVDESFPNSVLDQLPEGVIERSDIQKDDG